MTALNTRARRKGQKAMEEALTAAGRVRRRFKAGRPSIPTERLPFLKAIFRVADEADKAQGLMVDEGLDPKDIRCHLIYSTPDDTGAKLLPPSGEMHKFLEYFESLAKSTDVWFLGIVWQQLDREVLQNGQPGLIVWVTPFTEDPEGQKRIFFIRDQFINRPFVN